MINNPVHAESGQPSERYRWYVLGVLTLAYLVASIDKQILVLMIEPIREDMRISDTQVSLLAGFAFAMFYTCAGIPIAWLADQKSRRAIIIVGVAAWTFMTALCGLTRTFWQLFLARVGVGVGEAALTPSAYSIIADYFPHERLGRAIGVYMGGTCVGSGLALVIGGYVISTTADLPRLVVPFLGALHAWQLAFMIAAVPGLLVIVLLATVREPPRRNHIRLSGEEVRERGHIPGQEAIAFAARNRATYIPVVAGFAGLALIQNAFFVWTPTMFVRTYGWSASTIGYFFGISLITLGPLGAVGGGWMADRLSRRGHVDAPIRVAATVGLLISITATVMPLVPSALLSLALLAVLTVLLFAIGAVVPAAFQLVTPNQFRAQISAYTMLVVNLVGLGLGPTIVAMITDYGFGHADALRFSMSLVSALISPLAAVLLWSGRAAYSIQRAKMVAGGSF